MKTIILMLAIPISFLSCKKDQLTHSGLYETWQWEYSDGGFSGNDTISPAASVIVTLTLQPNHTYSIAKNGQVLNSGNIQIVTENNQQVLKLSNATPVDRLIMEENGTSVVVEKNSLHLTDYGRSEPYTHHFKKQGEK